MREVAPAQSKSIAPTGGISDFDDPLMDMPFEAEFDDEQLPEGLRMAIEDEAEAAKQLNLLGDDERVPEIHSQVAAAPLGAFAPSIGDSTSLPESPPEKTIARKVETVSLLEDDDLPPIRAEWPGTSAEEPQEVDLSDLSRSWAPGRGVGSSLKTAANTESASRSVIRAELSADAIDELLGVSSVEGGAKLDAVLRPELPKGGDFTFERELLGGREFVPAIPSQSPDWSLDEITSGSESRAAAYTMSAPGTNVANSETAAERSASVVDFPAANSSERGVSAANALRAQLPQFNLTMPHMSGLSASKLAARSAVGFVCSVPLALALFFWVWSKNIESTPGMLSEALHLETTGLPHLAPPTMELVDLASRSVTLDDGKRVLEITGSLLNATMKSYSGITLEARVFDAQNAVIDRMVVNLKNGLSGATVTSLSPETLSDLQQQGPSDDPGVEPNGRVPFRLIFTDIFSGAFSGTSSEPHDRAAWFSTKIYSVIPSAG